MERERKMHQGPETSGKTIWLKPFLSQASLLNQEGKRSGFQPTLIKMKGISCLLAAHQL
ncbi:MAG: hypothetical protein ACUVQY_04380 [Thermoproteota archaeon]